MATDVARASPLKNSILLDSLQLVEPAETHPPVPNHLLDTKIYRNLGQSKVVAVTPEDVHFAGFQVGKKSVADFCITNVCKDVISINILPPQSKYFKLHYKKPGLMIPGIKLNCQVEFLPAEWRYYYDCVRINCPGEENVVVPIHAYPVMNTDGFPQFYLFPPVPVGESVQNTFTLSCDVPVDFEFKLKLLQSNAAFTVQPMEGTVPANGNVEIKVTFSPSEFQTSSIQVELSISQFNSKPITCSISGSSMPGLQKEKVMKEWLKTEETLQESGIFDPQCITPLDRSRLRKKMAKKYQDTENSPQATQYKNKKMPIRTISAQTVAKVLYEKAGQLKAKDLRDALLRSKDSVLILNKQMKEAAFKNAVQQNLSDERQNQLRWQSKIGGEPMNETSKAQILEKRNHFWEIYRSESDDFPALGHLQTRCLGKRTSRLCTEIPEKLATFDPYTNNLWHQKLYTQQKFIQAVRKIILQNRAYKNMVAFRNLMEEWKGIKYDVNTQCLKSRMMKEKSKEQNELFNVVMSIDQYENDFVTVNPSECLDQRFERINQELEKQLDVRERTTVPYFDLMVPQYYKLQEYTTYNVHTYSYLSPNPSDYHVRKKQLVRSCSSAKFAARITKQSVCEIQTAGIIKLFPEPPRQEFKLPSLMLQPAVYLPEHMFNPLPNVQSFETPLPYSEGDADYHLCPVPRFPQKNPTNLKYFTTQKNFLDKENVIRGIMTWKRFPSPSLTGLSIMTTLGYNWLPIQDDLFKSGILPKVVPSLLFELPKKTSDFLKNETEKKNLSRLLDPAKANLTPEAVNEEFKFSSESDARKNRSEEEEELTSRLLGEFDQFGTRVQERVAIFSEFTTDQELLFR